MENIKNSNHFENFKIPSEARECLDKFQKAGFEAYIVGGAVRDMLLGIEPKDWDIATNAKPEEIQKIFPESIYENNFGTVGIKTNSNNDSLKIIEATTYRAEGKYTDKRHPDEVRFTDSLEKDLLRRDFTINALALKISDSKMEIVDLFGGENDIDKKIIRAVGKPEERFNEDALRMIRAVRLWVELSSQTSPNLPEHKNSLNDFLDLDWRIEKNTAEAISKLAGNLEMIAAERIRDELVKIIMTKNAASGILMLENLNLLRYILPELRLGIGVSQNKHHIYTVFEHNLRALDYSASQNYSLVVRLASLLHDIGKPQSKFGEGADATFYNHEIIGAKITVRVLDRLKFPKEIINAVSHLVRYHLFFYNVGEVTEAGVRRFLARVGPENISDLFKVREADRIGSGVVKAVPYKMRHLMFMIEKVKRDPISPKMLKINGNEIMKILNIPPGPKVGQIISILLEEVLDDPKKNSEDYLRQETIRLANLGDKKLSDLVKIAKERKEEFEAGIEEEIKKKFYVK